MRNYRNASGCASKNSAMRSEHSAIGKNPENTMKFSMFKEIEKINIQGRGELHGSGMQSTLGTFP